MIFFLFIAACGGGDKKEKTTPDKTATGSAAEPADPTGGPAANAGSGTPTMPDPTGMGSNDTAASNPAEPPPVVPPNFDPDPAQAKVQVDQHLGVARQALAQQNPDGDTALREARAALAIDAANVDAAAMVAFAYYHKHLYDTAELVLDDLFKRESAKKSANVYYVYGLVYDHTNRPDQAVLAFKKCVELDPNHASALVNLGVHALQNSQYGDAQQAFERLVNQFKRTDAITLTSLGSAYRGRSADYPAGSGDRSNLVRQAESTYKRATTANGNYGPAYYNLGLLYLDNDPYPGVPDPLARLSTARGYFDQYKNMPGVDIKLYDERMKDISKAEKRAQKLLKQKAKKGSSS